VFTTEVERIATTLRAVQARNITLMAPLLSFDGQGYMSVADRCERPFEQSFLDDKKYLFISYIYSTSWDSLSPEQLTSLRQRHLTSFKVKQDIFHAFFGNSLESAPEQQMPEATSPSDQMIDTQFTGPPSNEALLDIPYPSTPSTSTRNNSNNMQLASETTNVLSNNMQLALPQAVQHSEMDIVQLSSESNQVHVLKPLGNSIEKASAPPAPRGSSGIMGAHPVSDPMEIDMQERPEPLQMTDAPYGNSREESPERTLLGIFPAASVQPLETNKRPSEDFQHLLAAEVQVWSKQRTVKELMNHHASIQRSESKPILLYGIDTREYRYFKPQWVTIHNFTKTLNKNIKLRFLYLDQNEQLQCCSSVKSCYETVIERSRFMFFEICVPDKNVQGRKLSNLDPQVPQKIKAIESMHGSAFTQHRG